MPQAPRQAPPPRRDVLKYGAAAIILSLTGCGEEDTTKEKEGITAHVEDPENHTWWVDVGSEGKFYRLRKRYVSERHAKAQEPDGWYQIHEEVAERMRNIRAADLIGIRDLNTDGTMRFHIVFESNQIAENLPEDIGQALAEVAATIYPGGTTVEDWKLIDTTNNELARVRFEMILKNNDVEIGR